MERLEAVELLARPRGTGSASPVTARSESAAPPRASPSILVRTKPVTGIFFVNASAICTASCPVIPSSDELGLGRLERLVHAADLGHQVVVHVEPPRRVRDQEIEALPVGAVRAALASATGSFVERSSRIREDRAMYYAADGRLRVVDHRTATVNGPDGIFVPITFDFDEHRYDALGRRVLTRTQRDCVIQLDFVVCGLSTIRRSVWDGSQEIMEIQQPGHTGTTDVALETDTAFAARLPIYQPGGVAADLNWFYGRVAYTFGPTLDRPLSVTRWGFQRDSAGQLAQWHEPFTIVPHWNVRGGPDNGAFADGSTRNCNSTAQSYCVALQWPFGWTAHEQKFFQPRMWHGSLLEQKRDGSGLVFKRNRYLDPATGKFTQEDPIGLAGGLNLYGFADGDPVGYSDPFGLMSCPPDCGDALIEIGRLLQPAERPLEVFGTAVTGLVSGFGGFSGGIGREVLQLVGTLRSGAGSGILTAAGVAQKVSAATGGTIAPLSKSEGFGVTATITRRRDVVARIKSTGDVRVSVEGYGSLTAGGTFSSDRALTDSRNLTSDQIIQLVNRARELVGAGRR